MLEGGNSHSDAIPESSLVLEVPGAQRIHCSMVRSDTIEMGFASLGGVSAVFGCGVADF